MTTLQDKLTAQDLKQLSVDPVPDDEPFDEITIKIAPRFKTSGLSGDEWRHSARVRFWRKGMLAAEDEYTSMKVAADMLPGLMHTIPEMHNRLDRDRSEPTYDHPMFSGQPATLCFQPGCKNASTVLYRIKRRYSPRGHLLAERYQNPRPEHRAFCDDHKDRGNCGLDDAMDNYETVEVPGSVTEPKACTCIEGWDPDCPNPEHRKAATDHDAKRRRGGV